MMWIGVLLAVLPVYARSSPLPDQRWPSPAAIRLRPDAIVPLRQYAADECQGGAAAALDQAARAAEAFDLTAAADRYTQAASQGCPDAAVAAAFLAGWLAAERAVEDGGTPASLAPVLEASSTLERLAAGRPGVATIAKYLLRAAAAAAQSERDEMGVYLDEAVRLEDLQLAARQPAVPGVSAHEAAGDLWYRVHRFDDARRAYERAEQRLGATPRTMLGLARTAARLAEATEACAHYRRLLGWWGSRSSAPPEMAEARAYLAKPACR